MIPRRTLLLLLACAFGTAQAPAHIVGMDVPSGYQHREVPGIDTRGGVIWRDDGPRIDYEFGTAATQAAPGYWYTHKSIRTIKFQADGDFYHFVFDDLADTVAVTISGFMNLTATNVRTRADMSDVLLMVMSWDMTKVFRSDVRLRPASVDAATAAGMQLLPGYAHRLEGLGARKGVILKDEGPRIRYEFGRGVVRAASSYSRAHSSARPVTLPARGGVYELVFDDTADTVVITIDGFMNLTATNVRTKTDVADVLVMMMTFDLKKL